MMKSQDSMQNQITTIQSHGIEREYQMQMNNLDFA